MWSRENEFDYEVTSAAGSVPVALIKAVIGAESGFNPQARRYESPRPSLPPTPDFPNGGDMSAGLMQVLVRTARTLGYTGTVEGLFHPLTNVALGVKLLAENIRRTNGDFPRAVSAYNGGFRASLGYGTVLPSTGKFANQAYVDKVMRYYDYFRSREAPPGGSGNGPVPDPFEIVSFNPLWLVVGGLVAWLLLGKR